MRLPAEQRRPAMPSRRHSGFNSSALYLTYLNTTVYKMNGFSRDLTTTYVDIQHSGGIVKRGRFHITIDDNSIFVYILRDNNRIYWIGRRTGNSAKLSLKFNDQTHTITVNTSNKITFHRAKDYEQIKQKAIHYNHMKEGENRIVFQDS